MKKIILILSCLVIISLAVLAILNVLALIRQQNADIAHDRAIMVEGCMKDLKSSYVDCLDLYYALRVAK